MSGFEKRSGRREFVRNILFGLGGLAFVSSPFALIPKDAEARKRRRMSKRLEEKLKIADFYFSFHDYSKKEARRRYNLITETFNKVPPMLVEYYARTGDDTLYDAWEFMFDSDETWEDYRTAMLYLDLQKGFNQGRHFDLKRAKYEPMFYNEMILLELSYNSSFIKSPSKLREVTEVKNNRLMSFYLEGIDRMLSFLVDEGYKSNKTDHSEVSDYCIKMFSSSLFETYYPGSGERLGSLFFHVDLDKKKEMIYDLIIPKITEHGTLDKILEYKDNENLPLKERRELFYKGLVYAHNLPLENQIEYMKRLWASAAITALVTSYNLGCLFVTGYYQSYINKTYYDPGEMIYKNLERPYSLRKSENNYVPITRGPPRILPYIDYASEINF